MPLDQVQNFVEVSVEGTHTSSDTTIQLGAGEASNVPDPVNGEYNLVWFDDTNYVKPGNDPEVEIVRVTARDTANDTITVQRGQENTSAVAHDTSGANYIMLLSPTAKMLEDVDAANFSTNSVTVANTTISLGGSGTPEADNLGGANGTAGQVLQSDGTNANWADLGGGETVNTNSSDYTTSGETTVLLDSLASTTAFTLSASFYKNKLFDYSAETRDGTGITFGDFTQKMFVADGYFNEINQYTVDAGDITTASYAKKFSTPVNTLSSVEFNGDGTKMYFTTEFEAEVYEYTLSTAWDVTTASQTNIFTDTTNGQGFTGLSWAGGNDLYVMDSNKEVLHYTASTAYDTTTLNYQTKISVDGDYGVYVKDDGTKMFTGDNTDNEVTQYDLSTAYDLTTASNTGFIQPMSGTSPFSLKDLAFVNDGKSLTLIQDNYSEITQYSSIVSSTITLSSSDVSSGKIIRIKDVSGNIEGTGAVEVNNPVAVKTEGSESIDSSGSAVLLSDYGVKQLQSDGSDWFLISDG